MTTLLAGIGLLIAFTIFIYRQLLELRRQVGTRWAELEELLRQRGAMMGELPLAAPDGFPSCEGGD